MLSWPELRRVPMPVARRAGTPQQLFAPARSPAWALAHWAPELSGAVRCL